VADPRLDSSARHQWWCAAPGDHEGPCPTRVDLDRRELAETRAALAEAQAENERLWATLGEVRRLHGAMPMTDSRVDYEYEVCSGCGDRYPCATEKALLAASPARTEEDV
jgi:hypothetical protein